MNTLNLAAPPGDPNAAFFTFPLLGDIGEIPDPGTGNGATIEQIQALLVTMLGPITADIAQLQTDVALLVPATPGPIPPTSALYNPRFVDEDAVGIAQALVEVFQSSTRIGSGTTGADGRVAFSDRVGFVLLKNTAYSLRVYAAGYMAQAPISFTLTADSAPTYELEAAPPFSAPSDPALATLRVYAVKYDGTPINNAEITVTVKDARPLLIDGQIRTERFVKGKTNPQGWVDLAVIKSSKLAENDLRPFHTVNGPGLSVPLVVEVPDNGGQVGIGPVLPISQN
ncbi:carboxypeptidase regulatory-like domain-containing protein [bacterium]|nr:MAG: carboxypeptidase regulatory-like domain-containing protein [bacterium]